MPGGAALELRLRVVRPALPAVFEIEANQIPVRILDKHFAITDHRRGAGAAVEVGAVLKFHEMLEPPMRGAALGIQAIDDQFVADSVANHQSPFPYNGI